VEDKRAIALGFFDGVHRGHGELLKTARKRANELGCSAAVLTFDAHPDQVIFGQPISLISSMDDRKQLMTELYGMDEVLIAHFDKNMAAMPWEDFVDTYLIRDRHACHVVCGHDFSFGHRGLGNPARLKARCAEHGVGCDIIGKVDCNGITISSTYIRQVIAEGDMEEATLFLGHPHRISGIVCRGKQLGRRLGIPTANLFLPSGVLPPAFGVYATRVILPDGSSRIAVTNVGVRPTVTDNLGVMVEPWILDFDGDLYGQTISIEFHKQLRKERKFDSLDALKAEILKNAEETRAYFA